AAVEGLLCLLDLVPQRGGIASYDLSLVTNIGGWPGNAGLCGLLTMRARAGSRRATQHDCSSCKATRHMCGTSMSVRRSLVSIRTHAQPVQHREQVFRNRSATCGSRRVDAR